MDDSICIPVYDTVTFPADWHTMNFCTLADAECFHCIPASLMFYRVKLCMQVSLAVNMDSRNSHPSFNHWRREKKKKKSFKFWFLCSSVTHLVHNVHAFCNIHALHGHGAYNCDRKFQCSRYTIFLVCKPHMQLPFPHPFTQYSHYCKHKSYYGVLHMRNFKAGHLKVLIKRKTSFSPPKDCMTLTLVMGLAWSNESRSYAGGSVATGRVSHARLVCDEDPD
jgi:hypothetical protein